MVDLDPQALYAQAAFAARRVQRHQPAEPDPAHRRRAASGGREYQVRLNSSPEAVEQLNDLPIRTVNGATVYIKDVAYVRDGFAVQQQHGARQRARAARC